MDACKLINVKFFYAIPVNTFYELKALVDYGCCDVRIEAPLTHMLDKLEDYDIYFVGDGAGKAGNIVTAAATGLVAARGIIKNAK